MSVRDEAGHTQRVVVELAPRCSEAAEVRRLAKTTRAGTHGDGNTGGGETGWEYHRHATHAAMAIVTDLNGHRHRQPVDGEPTDNRAVPMDCPGGFSEAGSAVTSPP